MKNVLKLIALQTAWLAGAVTALAIPATPYPVKVTQPDGSELTLNIRGDERGFVMLTTDGYAVIQDAESGWYNFAAPDGDGFQSLGIAATMPEERTPEVSARLKRSGRADLHAMLDIGRAKSIKGKNAPQRVKISNYPTIGKQKALVILVEFADVKFSSIDDAHTYYDRMLNEEGFTWPRNGADGSVRDFYLASSSGMFEPEFIVVGPVTLDKGQAYYGGDTMEATDPHAIDMVLEAAKAADALVDYTEFDADSDGYVDNIYFFYAGNGQADSAISNSIWPHSGMVEDNWGRELVLDGMRINRYACSNELRGGSSASDAIPVGIGTFVHEFGHVLGIADHYDTAYSSGRIGVNQWDTMAAASYLNNQNTPPLFNAFERAELGWLEYTDIESDTQGWLDLPPLDAENKAYRITVVGTEGKEYFIMENRRKHGWDAYLPGEGMLVWHVDMDEQRWFDNTINNDSVHQHFDLVEADGKETEGTYASDPFPGKSGITSFSFVNWAGDEEFKLDHIIRRDENVRLLLGDTGFIPDMPDISIDKVGGKTLHFSWFPIEEAQYIVRLEDSEGNAVDGFDDRLFAEAEPVVTENLVPHTSYRVSVTALAGSYKSESASETFSTGDICFFEQTPQFEEPCRINKNSFTVSWEPMAGADDYIASLDKMDYGESVESVCDFSDGTEKPWVASSLNYNRVMYGAKSPSLQLDNDEDYLAFFTDEGRISEFSFWTRSQSSSNTFRVEYMDSRNETWILIAEETIGYSASEHTYKVPDAPAVRTVFKKKNSYMLLDDMKCVWRPLTWTPAGYDRFSTSGKCVFTPQNLNADTTYRVRVAGIDGGETSKTAIRRVTTSNSSSAGTVIDSSQRSVTDIYDTLGRKVNSNYKGIVILKYSGGAPEKAIM